MKRFVTTLMPLFCTPLLAMVILLSPPPAVEAQTERGTGPAIGRPSPSGTLSPVESARTPSIRERQMKIIEMEREAAKVRTPEEEKLALAQIAEDYEKLQVINNKMMSATMSAAAPDYQRVAETTAEIKTRAVRMKDNLRLAKPPANENEKRPGYKKAENESTLKTNLLSLDGKIMSFIKNPIFTNPAVVNLEQATKASTDLEAIIELSQFINKDAQRLGKSTGKE